MHTKPNDRVRLCLGSRLEDVRYGCALMYPVIWARGLLYRGPAELGCNVIIPCIAWMQITDFWRWH